MRDSDIWLNAGDYFRTEVRKCKHTGFPPAALPMCGRIKGIYIVSLFPKTPNEVGEIASLPFPAMNQQYFFSRPLPMVVLNPK